MIVPQLTGIADSDPVQPGAESLASIVRGLIALAAFSDEIEPEISDILSSTKVDVKENRLKISVTLSPETLVAALEEV